MAAALSCLKELNDGCGPVRPHRYPALVVVLNDAIWKLRMAQIRQRHAAKKRVQDLVKRQQAMEQARVVQRFLRGGVAHGVRM